MRKFHLFLYGFIFTVLTIAVFVIGCGGGGGGGGSSTGGGNVCADKSGNVTCGYCSQDALTSNNPNAGKCFYCPSGSSCSGTPCGGITCVTSGTGGGGGGGSTSCASGYISCSPSGLCCQSAYPYHCVAIHKCYSTAAGATAACGSYEVCSGSGGGGGGTGGGGGGGGTGGSCSSSSVRCDGSLECSQVVTVGSCSVQTCSCYTTLEGSDTTFAWYKANGVYYCCDVSKGNAASCVAAAQRVVAACGASLPW